MRAPSATGAGFDFYPLTGRTDAPSLRKVPGHVDLASTEHHNLIFDDGGRLCQARHACRIQHRPALSCHQDQTSRICIAGNRKDPRLGHEHRSQRLHWLQRLRRRLPGREQHSRRRQEQVIREREMHWLRIDRYYEGHPADPGQLFSSRSSACIARRRPAKIVCPVGATVHDSEGLNVMVYNRCIGTRFCSNNCPYKVRRFNYFDFASQEQRPPEARNPEVTVRGRGVMEKCTFCLQRIAAARIAADRENRPVGGGRTACQAACPTQAFTFGNMAEGGRRSRKRKHSPLDYALLADQNTRPRVTYEARISNPNPAIRARRMTDIPAPPRDATRAPRLPLRPPHTSDPVVLSTPSIASMTDQYVRSRCASVPFFGGG